ncbi:hypothetical protein VTN31DRAFT_6724 [Thermomyces dupontii]|uniref:uncharacterized protein n=1 Tax=Talaromyces thermophilus TaxID=28565 RepID=UPI003743CB08
MPPDPSCFTGLNLPQSFTFPTTMEDFTLSAGPNTDLWRKPPNGDTSTAPIIFTSLQRRFVVAEVTISADWEMESDQGGLVIFAGPVPTQSIPSDTASRYRSSLGSAPTCKWVKAGMEFASGTVNASSVTATPDGADWCGFPLALPNRHTNILSLRIKLERVGHALWIWYQVPSLAPHAHTPGAVGSTWKKLREVTWFFYGVEDKCVHVGVYASRPTNLSRTDTMWQAMHGLRIDDSTRGNELVVNFEDLEIF